jgi:hypothetical protein
MVIRCRAAGGGVGEGLSRDGGLVKDEGSEGVGEEVVDPVGDGSGWGLG